MQYLDTAIIIIGFALLVAGYRKSNRNVLAGAALVLAFGSASAPSEFAQGWKEGKAAAQSAEVKQ